MANAPPHRDSNPASGDPSVDRVTISFLAMAAAFFAAGLLAAPFVIAQATLFFYQPYLLALVHTFTLGWITAAIIGVMFRYVPALTRTPLRFPRMARVQFVFYIIGVSGMVTHFALGVWPGLWSAAIVVVLSLLMFAINLVPSLLPRVGRGVAETGMFLAIVFLLAAATWGTLVALDKTFNFLGGDLLSNIAGHVALAGIGWVALVLCAVSYRTLPAFLLPTATLPRAALWQLAALAGAAAGLAAVLLLRVPGAIVFAVLVAAALMIYVTVTVRMLATRRRPADWTARHATAGTVWLVAAAALGLVLVCLGAGTLYGSRVASAFVVLGLLGWVSNFIMGMSYQLFAGFVARARTAAGWPAVAVARLTVLVPRGWVCVVFNLGVGMLAAGLLAGAAPVVQAGAVVAAAGGVPYAIATLWTLSYAFRKSARAGAHPAHQVAC